MIPVAKCYPRRDGSWKGNAEGMFLRKEVRKFTPSAIFLAWGVGGGVLEQEEYFKGKERRRYVGLSLFGFPQVVGCGKHRG